MGNNSMGSQGRQGPNQFGGRGGYPQGGPQGQRMRQGPPGPGP